MKKLIKFLLFAALIAAFAKVIQDQVAKFKGLSEPELRSKMHDKLGDKMSTDQIDEIADKVVEKMRERGMLGDEAPVETV